MKTFNIILLFIIITIASFSGYYYFFKYKPLDDRIINIERERDVLLKRISQINISNEDILIDSLPLTNIGREIIDSLELEVEKFLNQLESENFIGASIEIQLDNFFDPESVTVWAEGGKDLLKRLANIINMSGDVKVVFSIYLDNYIPPEAEIYAIRSSWELSAKRGVDLIQFVVDSCDIGNTDISLKIFGSNFPKGDTTTEEGKYLSRRLIFNIIEK